MKKFLALSILALSVSAAGAAFAEHGGPHGHHGKKDFFKKFDANNDGVITKEEADAAHNEKFKKMDANNDGKVTREEVKAKYEAKKAEFIKKFDKDGDGKLSDEEKAAAKAERKAKWEEHKAKKDAVKAE